MKWLKNIAERRVIGKCVTEAENIHSEFLRARVFKGLTNLLLLKILSAFSQQR